MPPHSLFTGNYLPDAVPDPEYEPSGLNQHPQSPAHSRGNTPQDAAQNQPSVDGFTHTTPMIESLDDLLAGEIDIPTVKKEPYHANPFAMQPKYAPNFTDELDPVVVENARLDYEKYLEDIQQNPTPNPRIERVNDAEYFINKGVVTGTSYSVQKVSSRTPIRRPRNAQIRSSYIPDFNSNLNLWETREERSSAINHQNCIISPHASISEYFVWGISYNPPERLSQGFRAVRITIPIEVSLKDIINRINTGSIYSATLCNTVKITRGLTAYIVFVYENGAARVKSDIHSNSFDVVHITYHPTWPINPTMIDKIKQGWTRCLTIKGLPPSFSKENVHGIVTQPGYCQERDILEVQQNSQGDFHLEFSSISAAGKVYRSMYTHYKGSKVVVGFDADPCDPHPVPFETTREKSIGTLTPLSFYGNQSAESNRVNGDTTSLLSKYGPPPPFSPPEILSEGNTQPLDLIDSRRALFTSSVKIDAEQYNTSTTTIQDDTFCVTQQAEAGSLAGKGFSNIGPTFAYHGSGINWADEMIDEASKEI